MAGEWIKLAEQPEGPKVARLAALTGASKEMVFCAIVRWFHHVDANYVDGSTSIDRDTFHDIAHWKPLTRRQRGAGRIDLAEAMQDKAVDWLAAAPDGRLTVTRFDSHFGQSAKRRAIEARRKRAYEQHRPPRENPHQPRAPDAREKRGNCAAERERERSSSQNDDERGGVTAAVVGKIFDQEGFPRDDPLRRDPNATAAQMAILTRNADYLAKTRGFRRTRRAYIAAGIRGKFPLDDRLLAADREAESVRWAHAERAKERAQERTQMAQTRALRARFAAYLKTLSEPQLAELVDRAIAELPDMFKDAAKTNRNVSGPEANEQLRCFAIGIWQREVDEPQEVLR